MRSCTKPTEAARHLDDNIKQAAPEKQDLIKLLEEKEL